jgi:hypothetical protein
MMSITRLQMSTAATVSLFVSLFVAGPAVAEVWPEGRNGAELSTQVSYPDAFERAVANHRRPVLAPDDRARVRTPDQLFSSQSEASVAPSAAGFDWVAASIGASTTAALLVITGGGLAVVRRAGRKSQPLSSV